MNRLVLAIILTLLLSFVPAGTNAALLFSESFENSNFSSRGWYDGTGGVISTTVYHGGAGSFYCNFNTSSTNCTGGDPRRIKFTATDEAYISFWIRFSSNWTGSNKSYHPHIIYLLTDLNGDYDGFYGTYTTGYIEERNNTWSMGIQDGLNINESYIGSDLCDTNENRAAHGCNGICDGNSWDNVDCYYDGDDYVNGRWTSAGTITNETWYFVEAYFKMNTISGSKGQKDGVMWMKVNGSYVINYTDIIFRTNTHPTMKWTQLAISPYMGDGSPIAQQLWIDDMEIHNSAPVQNRRVMQNVTGVRVTLH